MDRIASQLRESRAYEISSCTLTASTHSLIIDGLEDDYVLWLNFNGSRYQLDVFHYGTRVVESEFAMNAPDMAIFIRDLPQLTPEIGQHILLINALAELLQQADSDCY